MPKPFGLVWISAAVYYELLTEAERKYPDETGGILVGYWVHHWTEAVITSVIGPGPFAIHSSTDFTPDNDYQSRELEKLYFESGRLHSYIGDWHTHPLGDATLSVTDRKTLRRIAEYPEARASIPLMIVIGGNSQWAMRIWRYRPSRIRQLHFLFKEHEMTPRIY